ncbi:PaaI family thioesterase [Luteimonas suaedae]|uniref:PaaI family thioesterase n=1 Tax=Luteimonas suaedae TaxID=2605430 RepID=UPI0011ED9F18|nr:PaaI family thioesterase [Luteimonas suaedae]
MNKEALFWKIISGEFPLPSAATMMGWKFIRYVEETQEIHVEFDAKAAFTNPLGKIQGGMLSAMLDDSMGPALYLELPPNRLAVTIESKTSFVSPAVPGKIMGIGKLEHLKGLIGFTSGRLLDEHGEVLATATATHRIIDLAKGGGDMLQSARAAAALA